MFTPFGAKRQGPDPVKLAIAYVTATAVLSGAFVAFNSTASLALSECVTSNVQTADGTRTLEIRYTDNTSGCDWTVPPGVTSIATAVVGAGGAGGSVQQPGGGGGGAVLYNANLTTVPGSTLSTVIGQGVANVYGVQARGSAGGSTTFGSVTASGGGGGGSGNQYQTSNHNGGASGSTGGSSRHGRVATASTQAQYSGWTVYANSGGIGSGATNTNTPSAFNGDASPVGSGGGGGGAGGAGSNGTTVVSGSSIVVTGGDGGPGIYLFGKCLGAGAPGLNSHTSSTTVTRSSSTFSTYVGTWTVTGAAGAASNCVDPQGNVVAGSATAGTFNQNAVQNTGSAIGADTISGDTNMTWKSSDGVVIVRYNIPRPTITSSAYSSLSRPTISGTGVNGSTVTVQVGGATYTRTVADGIWSVNLQTATPHSGAFTVASGYTVSATQTDSQGDISAAVTQNLVVDASAPSAPTGANLASSSNSGSALDRITNVTSPTIDVSGLESGAAFTVTATLSATTVTCTGTATGSTGSCVLPNLTAGTWAISAKQADLALNESNSFSASAIQIRTSVSAPVIANTANLVNTSSVSVSFSVVDATAKCSLDGSSSVSCTSPLTTPTLGQGAHVVVVTATDIAGNTASSSYSFTVDSEAPSLPTVSTSALFQTTTTPSISFSGEGTASFLCKMDAGSYSACTSPYSPATLSEGAHTFYVKQIDGAGNTSAVQTYAFTVDTVTPSLVTITSVSPFVNTVAPHIVFTGEPGVTFNCRIDASPMAPCSSPYIANSLTESSHVFYVTQTDGAGHVSAESRYDFTVDVTAPVAAIASPQNVHVPSPIAFVVSVNEELAEDPSTGDFTVVGDGCVVSSVVTSGDDYVVTVTGCHDAEDVVLTLENGVTDAAGNVVASVSSSVVVTDGVVPTVSITSPSTPNNATSQVFTITLSEEATGFDESDLDIIGSAANCDGNVTSTSSRVFNVTLTGCGEGTVGVSVRSAVLVDAAGNTGPASSVTSSLVTIDVTAPVITWTMTPPTWASVASVTPSWTVTGSSVNGSVIRQVAPLNSANICGTWSDEGSVTSGVAASVSDRSCYRWKFSIAPQDAAGNSAVTNLTSDVVKIDRSVAAPNITSATPAPNSNSYTVSFDGEAGATFRCSLDGASAQACSSPVALVALADGSHVFDVYQTDLAGNLSSAAQLTWNIDTQIQNVVLGAPASPTNSTSLAYTVAFDKSVTGVTTSDFSAPGTSCAVSGVTGSGRNYTVTLTDCAHDDVVALELAAESTTDASGNVGPSVVAVASSVTVDREAPSAPLVSFTGTGLTADSATFNILGEAGSTYQCALDGASSVACAGPTYEVGGLGVGEHSLSVTQSDLAGNVSDATVETWTTELPMQVLTPTPTIAGTLLVGQTLTLTTGAFDTGTTLSIAWLRDGNPISGATSSTYTLTASDLFSSISVQVTSTRSGYQDAIVVSANSDEVQRGSLALSPNPSISGTTTYGHALSVNTGTWTSGVTLTYQWLRGGVDIPGATGTTYTLGLSDIGERVGVRVTGSKSGYTTVSRSVEATNPVALETISQSSIPTISGDYVNGAVLTANTGTWTTGVDITYRWLRNSLPIPGATAASYTVTSDDIDSTISVEVTGALLGHSNLSRTSESTSEITGARQTLTPTPSLTGTFEVGRDVTVSTGIWDDGVTLSYQWVRGSTIIVGATSPTYRIVASDFGVQISVRVTGSKPGFSSVVRQSSNSSIVAAGPFVNSPTPVLSGDTQVGRTLVVTPGTWDSGTTLSIQWLRNGTPITGATSLNYVLVGTDYRSAISVNVTGTKLGYVTTTRTSSEITGIQPANLSSTPVPTILGLPTVGQAVVAQTTGWDTGVAFTYRWFADNVEISGATSSSYTPTVNDADKRLTVEVTGTKFGYVSAVKTSAQSASVASIRDFESSSVPIISGEARVGQTLTVEVGTWDTGTTLAIQWMRSGLPIAGATDVTYGLVADDLSSTMTVIVRGQKNGYNALSRLSNEIGPIDFGIQAVGSARVSGTPQVGQTLVVETIWSNPGNLRFQWAVDNVPIAGATSRTLSVGAEYLGKSLDVRVDSLKSGYVPVSINSASVGPVGPGYLSAPTLVILGEPEVGNSLRVKISDADPLSTVKVQWMRDSEKNSQETNETYVVHQSDIGHVVSVRVTLSRAGYVTRDVSLTTNRVVSVTAAESDLSIRGTATIGEDLVVVNDQCAPGVSYSYQWLRNGIAIAGATDEKYTVTSADQGATITAVATQIVDGEPSVVTVSQSFSVPKANMNLASLPDSEASQQLSLWEMVTQFFGTIWSFVTSFITQQFSANAC